MLKSERIGYAGTNILRKAVHCPPMKLTKLQLYSLWSVLSARQASFKAQDAVARESSEKG